MCCIVLKYRSVVTDSCNDEVQVLPNLCKSSVLKEVPEGEIL
jgi:hypothetical protein